MKTVNFEVGYHSDYQQQKSMFGCIISGPWLKPLMGADFGVQVNNKCEPP